MRTILVVLQAGVLLGAESIGFRNDGSGVFPEDCAPVTEWSEEKNVVWKTPLPNFGQSSPVYANGRVFVTCEPGWKHDAPLLACLDARTGKILWEREVDQFALLPTEEQAEARALRKKFFEQRRLANRLKFELDQDPSRLEELKAVALREGLVVREKEGKTDFGADGADHAQTETFKTLREKFDFHQPVYHHGTCGVSFATPVTDGKHVWVVTAYKVVACYSFEGDLTWMRWHRDEDYATPRDKESGMHFTTSHVPSPRILGDTLLVNGNVRLRACDKATGKPRWEHRLRQVNHMIGELAFLRMVPPDGGEPQDLVCTASGAVVRLSDGKLLTANVGNFGRSSGPIAIADDAIFAFNGSTGKTYIPQKGRVLAKDEGSLAIRFRWAGPGRLEPEMLWHNDRAQTEMALPVFHDGMVYIGRRARLLDPRTGELGKSASGPSTFQGLVVAGGHVFAQNKQGECGVYKTGTLETVAMNELDPVMEPLEGEKRDQVIEQSGIADVAKWHGWNFSPALPFFTGNRMFLRSHDALYCIGDPGEDFRSSPAHETP